MSEGPPALLFARKFLRHGTRVASFAPSSRWLGRAMCRHVDPNRPQTILELGAGTGAVTRVAEQRMHADSSLYAVEIDSDFADVLAQQCPRATVLRCDVKDLTAQLEQTGIDQVDVVLSGLPTPSLPRAVNEAVLDLLKTRCPEGYFSQLTVMPWVYKGLYQKLFEEVSFDLVTLNLPPGGVYHCRRIRHNATEHLPKK